MHCTARRPLHLYSAGVQSSSHAEIASSVFAAASLLPPAVLHRSTAMRKILFSSVGSRMLPFLLLGALPTTAAAQIDVAKLQLRAQQAQSEADEALRQCKQAVGAVRASSGKDYTKVHGDCDGFDNVLLGGTFDSAIGGLPIALDHLESVPEELRQPTRVALLRLGEQLNAGSMALLRLEALQELVVRLEYLHGLAADGDASSSLVDLAASAWKATRSQALPRAEIAYLRQQLAKRQQQDAERAGAEAWTQAKTELAALQVDFPGMRSEMTSAASEERDRGFARFDEAARSIRTALARVAPHPRSECLAELGKLQTSADELYRQRVAAATLERVRGNFDFTADMFTGQEDEAPAIAAAGYVTFDPPSADVFSVPKTVALVGRSNVWSAFVGTDTEYRRNAADPALDAYCKQITSLRTRALAKLLPACESVVDGMAAVEIADDVVRGRLVTLADQDLPLALQLAPQLPALRSKVHALLDAHDQKQLGDVKALALRREQAVTAADNLWTRFQQWLPVHGGFEPAAPSLFVGQLMRLEGVALRSDEFAKASHDFVFELGGKVFAATMTEALAAEVATATRRLQLPTGGLHSLQPCELLAIVGGDVELQLLGAKGAEDAIAVPAVAMQVVGLRQGALCAVAQ
jgi:hypothetical protein